MSESPDVPASAALIQMTAEVVAAYVTKNHVRAAELPDLISTIHGALSGLGKTMVEAPTLTLVPAVLIKKSVHEDYIVCLDDGKRFKSLKRHIGQLGMTPEQYRAKWGLPADYPMVAPAYAKARSELAKNIGLGSFRRKA